MSNTWFIGTDHNAIMYASGGSICWSGLSILEIDRALAIIEGLKAALPEGKRIDPIGQILHQLRDWIVDQAEAAEQERERACQHPAAVEIDEHLHGAHWVLRCVACNAVKAEGGGNWYNDTTGLCTVREFAEELLKADMKACPSDSGFVLATPERMLSSPAWPWGEMAFTHNGKKYNVEMVVTKVEDVK